MGRRPPGSSFQTLPTICRQPAHTPRRHCPSPKQSRWAQSRPGSAVQTSGRCPTEPRAPPDKIRLLPRTGRPRAAASRPELKASPAAPACRRACFFEQAQGVLKLGQRANLGGHIRLFQRRRQRLGQFRIGEAHGCRAARFAAAGRWFIHRLDQRRFDALGRGRRLEYLVLDDQVMIQVEHHHQVRSPGRCVIGCDPHVELGDEQPPGLLGLRSVGGFKAAFRRHRS